MSLIEEAREAWRYRELLKNLVDRELQVRYKNSVLGVVWSLANPIVRAAILWAVFSLIVPLKIDNYSAYVLAAFFPWTFFLTGVLDAGDSVSRQMSLVRKVYFPRELLPLATTIANLRHFFLSLGVLAIYLIVQYNYNWWIKGHHELPPSEIFLLPLLIVMETLLIGGIAFFLSAMNVFFEDVKFLTAVVLDLLFYGVPIIYFIEQVQFTDRLGALGPLVYHIFLLNPMTIVLVGYRTFLLGPSTGPLGPDSHTIIPVNVGFGTANGIPWVYFFLAFAVSVAAFAGGYAFFNSRKWRFVEQM